MTVSFFKLFVSSVTKKAEVGRSGIVWFSHHVYANSFRSLLYITSKTILLDHFILEKIIFWLL
jgi:hypothetical protein